jgi:hypothetical protein
VAYTILSGDVDGFGLYKANVNGTGVQALDLQSGIQLNAYWTPNPDPGRSRHPLGGMQLGRPQRPRVFGK